MANLLNQRTGDIRGRLMQGARSTVTGGPMAREDDYLDRYLPSNIIKADTTIEDSSPSQDVGAIPVSGQELGEQPRIESPVGPTADEVTRQDVDDIIDFAKQAQQAVDAGQSSNILSPYDPNYVEDLRNKANSLMEQSNQDTIRNESNLEATEFAAPPIIPYIGSQSTAYDPEGQLRQLPPISEAQKKKAYTDFQKGIDWDAGKLTSMAVASPAVFARATGAPDWLLDPMFSFLNDMQSIRASTILGDIMRVNAPIDKQTTDVKGFLDAVRNRDSYRKYLEANYDTADPEAIADVQSSLADTEEYIKNNQTAALESLRTMYNTAREGRAETSDVNPMSKYVDFTTKRDQRGIAVGQVPVIKNITGLYDYVDAVKKKNDEETEKRIADYHEEQKVLHLMNEIYRVSDNYNKKRQETDFEWLNPASWYYHVPGTMGSSFAEARSMALQFATATAAHYVGKGMLARAAATGGSPHAQLIMAGQAFLVGTVTTYTNYVSRAQESGAEVYDAYKQKLYDKIEKGEIDFDKVMSEGYTQLAARGINVDELTQEELFDEMLASGIRTSDAGYNQATKEALVGLDNLWQQNMAIGSLDMAESLMIVPGVGKMLLKGAKAVAPGATETAIKIAGAEIGEKLLTKTTKSIAKNMPKITATGAKVFIKKGLTPAAKVLGTMLAEATEEGTQWMGAYGYMNDRYQPGQGFLANLIETPSLALNAWRGVLGFHSDDAVNNDKDLSQSMNLGAVVGGIIGGGGVALPSPHGRGAALDYADAMAGSKIARQMTAEHIAAKEDMANMRVYAQKAMTRPESRNYYIEQMEDMKNMLPEGGALTKEDVDTEIARAKKAFAMVDDKLTDNLRKAAGIKKYSDDHQSLIAMRIRSAENYNNARKEAINARARYEASITSPDNEIESHLDAQGFSEGEYVQAVEIAKMNSEIEFLQEFIDGIKDFHTGIDEANKKYAVGKDPIFNVNKENVENYIYEAQRILDSRKRQKEATLSEYKGRLEEAKRRAEVYEVGQPKPAESVTAVEESVEDEVRRLENTIKALEDLNLNSISYGGVSMLGDVIATQLNLKEATFRNAIYNGMPGSEATYGKKQIKNNVEAVKEGIAAYNQATNDNEIINAISIDQQHNEILKEYGEAPAVVEDIDIPNASERADIAQKIEKGKDPVSPVPAPAKREQVNPTISPAPAVEPEQPVVHEVSDEAAQSALGILDETGLLTIRKIQIKHKLGYNKAAAIIDSLVDSGEIVRDDNLGGWVRPTEAPVATEEAQAAIPTPEVEKVAEKAPERVTEAPAGQETFFGSKVGSKLANEGIGDRVFRVFDIEGNTGKIEYVGPDNVNLDFFEDGFRFKNNPKDFDPATRRITTVEPGTAKRFSDGSWAIDKKAVLEFSGPEGSAIAEELVSDSIWGLGEGLPPVETTTPIVVAAPEAVAEETELTPFQRANNLINKIDEVLNNVNQNDMESIKSGFNEGNRLYAELSKLLLDPFTQTSDMLEDVYSIEDRLESLNNILAESEAQPAVSPSEQYAAMPPGVIDTEASQEDKGENPTIPDTIPSTNDTMSQEANEGSNDGTAQTEEFADEVDWLLGAPEPEEEAAANAVFTEAMAEVNPEKVEEPIAEKTLTTEDRIAYQAEEIGENDGDTAKENFLAQMGVTADPDTFGMNAGTVFFNPNAKSNLPGYESGAAFAGLLADPRGLDGADIFITVDPDQSEFSRTYRIAEPATWDDAAIRIHVHKDGKKYAGALRTPVSFRRWHESFGKDINPAELAALNRLRESVVALKAKYGEGVKIVPQKVSRNSGRFNVNMKDGQRVFRPVLEVKGLGISPDVTQLEANGEMFAIGKGVRGGWSVTRANGEIIPGFKANSGVVLFFPSKSNTTSGKLLPHKLNSVRLSSDPQAMELVWEAITQPVESNPIPSILESQGIRISGTDVINMIVNYGDQTALDTEAAGIAPFLIPKQFYYDSKAHEYVVGTQRYTKEQLRSEEGKAQFIEQLGTDFHFTTPLDQYWTALASSVRNSMIANNKKSVELSKHLKFDMQDIGAVVDEDGLVKGGDSMGLTTLQWQVKNNLLLSDMSDQLYTDVFMYVDDVKVEIPEAKQNTQEVVQEEVTPIVDKKPEEPKTDINKKLHDAFGFDMRIGDGGDANITNKEMARLKKINTKKAVKWLTKKLGLTEDQVMVTNGVIRTYANGSRVYGRTISDAIILSKDAVIGTEYHEAWHRVSLLVLPPAQREKLYAEARMEFPEYALLSNTQLEEVLAERFRDYMVNNRGIKYTIQKAFSAIRTFVGKMFGMATQPKSGITQMYEQIARGDFKNYKLDAESIKAFDEAAGGVADFTVGPNNDYTPKNIIMMGDYYDAIKSLASTAFVVKDVQSLADIERLDLADVKTSMEETIAMSKNESVAATLQELLDVFDTVVAPEIIDEMRNISIKMIENKSEEDKAQDDAGEVGKASYNEKPSFYSDKKATALPGAKLFIYAQPAAEFGDTKVVNGVKVSTLKPVINPITGLTIFNDFGSSWNSMLNNMYMVNSFEEAINRAKELGEGSAFFALLARRLQKLEDSGNHQLTTQILQAIRSHKLNMMTLKYGVTPSEDGKTAVVSWHIDDSDTDRVAKNLPGIWSSNFYGSEFVDITDKGASLNQDKVRELQGEYADLVKRITAPAVTQSEATSIVSELVKILQRVGISVDADTIESMLLDKTKYPDDDRAANLKRLMLNETTGSLSFLIRDLPNADKTTEVKTKRGKTFVKSLATIYTASSASSFVNQAAKNYAKVNPDPEEMKVLGPDGNLLYPHTQHNYMSNAVDEYNRPDSEMIKALDADIYARHSLLRSAFKSKGAPVRLYTFTNFKAEVGGDKGRSYTDISPVEDYLSKMALTAAGHIILPTMADKGTWHTLYTGVKTFDMPLEITLNADNNYVSRVSEEALSYLSNQFLDEFNTVVQYWKNKDKVDANKRLAVANYHTKDLGGMFRHFDWVYKRVDGEKTWVKLNDEIKKRNGNPESTLEFLQSVKEFMVDDRVNAMNVMNNILQTTVENELNTLLDFGAIRIVNGMYKNAASKAGTITGLDQVRLNAMKRAVAGLGNDAIMEHYAIESMVTNHTVNTIMSIIETEKVFTGDPAFFKNTDDQIKRLPAVLSTGDNLRTSWPKDHRLADRQSYTVTEFLDNEIPSAQYDTLYELTKAAYKHKNPNASDVEVNAFARNSVAGYGLDSKGRGQMNQTDASVFISPQMYMDLMEMLGEVKPEMKKAFDLLMSDNTDWLSNAAEYHEALQVVTKPLKMMHFGFRASELGIRIPVFDKMALFPMFKIFATGDMQALYERMTSTGDYVGKKKVDMVKFVSAVKVGSQSPMAPYTDSSNKTISNFNNMEIYSQEFKNLRRQLITDPHHEERQMLGSQVAKGVMANLRLGDTYGDGVVRNKFTGAEIRDHVYSAMNTLSNQGAERFKGRFTTDGVFDMQKFSDELRRMAKSAGMSPELIDGLKYSNGKFDIPNPASSDSKWMQSSINSAINDEAININLPGGAFIQMSSFATNSIATLKDSAVNGGRRLKIHNTEGDAKGSMDAIVSMNLLKHILPNRGEGMSFTDQVKWLKAHDIIGNGDRVGAIAIGYRIPTQGMSSISSLRIVDVLPGNIGDTIVLPDEFTKLTGSDFDIDKLYVARYNYDKNGRKIEFDYTKPHSEQSREANENLLLDMYQTIMTDPNNVDETKAPLDNTTDIYKYEILPIIDSGLAEGRAFPFKEASPTFQLNKKYEYTGGKNGIAPFALNSVHHPITQSVGLKFSASKLLNQFGFGDLSTVWDAPVVDYIRDKKGYITGGRKDEVPLRVLDHLSAMINANVDVAKDPYVIRMGINQWTYNMANFLLRSGNGKKTYYFLAQPILKEMSLAYAQLQGKYGVNSKKSKSALEKDELKKIVNKYVGLAQEAIQALPERAEERRALQDELNSVSEKIGEGYTADTNTMNTSWLIDNLHGQLNPDARFYINQLKAYDTFAKLNPYARELSDLVHLSQIDTKKFGNNFSLHRQFMHNLKHFILHSKYFSSEDMVNYFKNTFLDAKIRNSMMLGRDLFSGQFFNTTTEFENSFDNILGWMGEFKRNTKDESIIKSINNELEASVKGQFFANHMLNEGLNTADMLYGQNSMARRLDNMKKDILLGKYPEMLTADNKIKNEFLNHLATEYRSLNEIYESPDIITTPALRGNDKLLDRRLIKYWEELYTSPHEEIAQFARDLVSYAFLTSGDNFNKNSFFNLVPNSIRKDIGYTDSMSQALEALDNSQYGLDEEAVYLNNWHNDNLVPHAESVGTTTEYVEGMPMPVFRMKKLMSSNQNTVGRKVDIVDGQEIVSGYTYPVIMTLPGARAIGNNARGESIFPRYVKYSLTNDNNPATTILYRFTGSAIDNMNKVIPVYVAVHKKGMHMNGKVVKEYNDGPNSGLPFNNLPYARGDNYDALFQNVTASEDAANSWKAMLDNMRIITDFRIEDERAITYEMALEVREGSADVAVVEDATPATASESIMLLTNTKGTTSAFEEMARKYGIENTVKYGEGDMASTAVEAEEAIYKQNDAANMLGRKVKSNVAKELQLHWPAIKYADAVFAVGTTIPGKDSDVMGTAGWAVAYAQMANKPIYLFNQANNQWTKYDYLYKKFLPYAGIPTLTQNFAGIGTSSITEGGYLAVQHLFENTFGSPIAEKAEATKVDAVSEAQVKEIYSKLGDRTSVGNVIINPVYQKAGIAYAKSIGGVFSLRVSGMERHFGNPYTHDERLAAKDNLILVESTKNAVESYINWALNSPDARAAWIREMIDSGQLKDRPIVYYKELGEPSHATALDFLINKYSKEAVATSTAEEASAQRQEVVDKFTNELNDMFNENPDMNRQEVEAEFNEIVKAHEDKSADSLNEALTRFICR